MHPLEGCGKIACECDLDFGLTCTLEHVAPLPPRYVGVTSICLAKASISSSVDWSLFALLCLLASCMYPR